MNLRWIATAAVLWSSSAVASFNKDSTSVVIDAFSSDQQIANFKHEQARNITIVGDEFLLDGQPLHIMSGSLHYFRLPSQYWRDRLHKLKAAGLNSVATYVEWSFHEPEERQYNFSGDHDVAQFIRIAAEEGLHVLLRPGPYICAERDLGGFPYWLLGKYAKIALRSTDKDFIEETRIWMAKLFDQLGTLLYGSGGPIILVQVENEYGSYGGDEQYKKQIRDIIKMHVGSNALLYTADGTDGGTIKKGMVPGALTTINFGPDNKIPEVFDSLRLVMPTGPLMNSEYYPGWLTHWTESFQRVSTEAVVRTLVDMMTHKINFNFYMFFGGTNFEFTAGANYGNKYQPDITSYDYDAPLSEAGDPTSKYYAIRNALEQFDDRLKNTPIPQPSPKGKYGTIKLLSRIDLLSSDGISNYAIKYKDVSGPQLPTFEKLRQRAGLMVYEMITNMTGQGILTIKKPRDRVYIYVDGKYQGIMDRMTNKIHLQIQFEQKSESRLSLVVEEQGRINYGSKLHDYKGILSNVRYNDQILEGPWRVYGYPLENIKDVASNVPPVVSNKPVLYKGELTLPEGEQPLDTFLDTSLWGKGYAWVNGHNLGRYWPQTGPQVTLYVPGVWLRPAPEKNTIYLLELELPSPNYSVELIDHPILG